MVDTPRENCWADKVNDPLPPRKVPIIFANQERLRQFKLRYPHIHMESKEYIERAWKRFIDEYNDGVIRL